MPQVLFESARTHSQNLAASGLKPRKSTDLPKRRLREVQPEEPFEQMIAAEVSEEEGQKAEAIERMKEALKSLRPEDRYLLRMRFWKGMRVDDIAEVIGVSYSATAVRLFRILSRLREANGAISPVVAAKYHRSM
jgi:RNA polymerase sigma factor (sigma-70 family)